MSSFPSNEEALHVDLERAEPGSAAEEAAASSFVASSTPAQGCCCLCWSQLPATCLQLVSPRAAEYLVRSGHGQLLVIRDGPHFCLWFSAFISFVYILIWLADVLSGNCLISLPSAKGVDSKSWACFRCAFESLAVLIFVGSLQDSFRMISHYDDTEKHFLNKRKRELERTQEELEATLNRVRDLLQALQKMVKKQVQEALHKSVVTVFNCVLPKLREASNSQQLELTEKLCENIVEVPPELFRVRLEAFRQGHPDTAAFEATKEALEKCKKEGKERWKKWLEQVQHGESLVFQTCSGSDEEGEEEGHHLASEGEAALLPLKAAFKALEKGRRCIEEELQAISLEDSAARSGEGEAALNRSCCWCCCLPGLVAFVLKVIIHVCCCGCRCKPGPGCCQEMLSKGDSHPKRCCRGEIRTRLQEQLWQGIAFGLIFIFARSCFLYVDMKDSRGKFAYCAFIDPSASWVTTSWNDWHCVYEVSKKLVSIFAMAFQVLCLGVCLCNRDKLDAVEGTLVANDRLVEIKEMLSAYNNFTDKLGGKQLGSDRSGELWRAIIYYTEPTRILLAMLDTDIRDKSVEADALIKELLKCLKSMSGELGPLEDFVKLEGQRQEETSKRAQTFFSKEVTDNWPWREQERRSSFERNTSPEGQEPHLGSPPSNTSFEAQEAGSALA